ncbi:hypothetical protein [Pisciglobus halotolerans]|uniref:Uncharacterized protein n=1 Tax=Pisciglobus halotolerans TaxID=745365 RepID=A0A1I3BIS8_9LACT|nr:hypothetical protein [Pisciglobus halotolerans]SFH62234.1 hypothetical protein SAMN04489868_1079 [Pisciglobus halotolerans]
MKLSNKLRTVSNAINTKYLSESEWKVSDILSVVGIVILITIVGWVEGSSL